MKKTLYILLIFLPTLLVSQYHDAQWIWDDYKLDFRKNNDSVLVYTGKNMQKYFHFDEEYNYDGVIYHFYDLPRLHLMDFCHANGEMFIHINNDSTWINKYYKSTVFDANYHTLNYDSLNRDNGTISIGPTRDIGGVYKLNDSILRVYKNVYFKRNDEPKETNRIFSHLIYDDIGIDSLYTSVKLEFTIALDSLNSFTLMPYETPDKHWIIGRYRNFINSYLVDGTVINPTPNSKLDLAELDIDPSWVKYYHSNNKNYFEYKGAPNGKLLLIFNSGLPKNLNPKIYLYSFDNANGGLKLITYFENLYDNYYDVDVDKLFNFSPNSKYIYISALNTVEQYDISTLDSASIHSSKFTIAQLDTTLHGEHASYHRNLTNFLIAPNGKLYYRSDYTDSIDNEIKNFSSFFSVIERPDRKGDQSMFNLKKHYYNKFRYFKDYIVVNNKTYYKPRWNKLQPPSHMIGRNVSYCAGEDAYLNNVWRDEFVGTNFKWELLNLESDDEDLAAEINKYFEENEGIDEPYFPNATHNHEGKYYITWTDTLGYNRERIVNLYVDTLPKVNIVSTKLTEDCERERYRLQPETIVERYEYRWSTGETTPAIEVDSAGEYKLYITSFQGCVDSSNIIIDYEDDEIYLEILGGDKLCHGSTITLSANQDYESYLWNTDETTKSIDIDNAGQYILTVETTKGCIISDTVEITYHPNVIAELKPAPTTICEGDSVLLESKYDAPYFDYLWNTEATTKSIYARETGTYKLTITDTRTGCMDSTEIAISVEDNLQPTIIGTNICEGETATLEALPNDPIYSYEWSNGETTPTIEVSQPATYTVTVRKDGCSGTAEFTVNESPNPEFEILGEDIVCGNTAMLSCSKDYAEYLWSTDEITKEIEVTEPGRYSLTVTDENGCQATEEFTVNEQSLSFDISKDRIDFGKVYISETAIDSAEIINTSGFDITIQSGDEQYRILDGQTVQYNKTLNPTELGPYTDSFEYRVIEPCDTVITIPVTAEVYAKVEISTKEETETEIGKEESIPVYLQAEADLGEQTYSITTDIDKTVLFTEEDYTITQTAPINKAKTKVHEISGMIMLASELEYDITFPSYEFNNPYIEVINRPGKILIDSVCAFPLRNVTFLESTEMKVSPNPARDRLVVDIFIDIPSDIELVEMEDENKASRFDRLSDQRGQQMRFELISAEGRVAYTENWTQSSSEKQISINTDEIPSGLYQVRLQTPSGVLTENVIVVR
jgi:hypothetical protein